MSKRKIEIRDIHFARQWWYGTLYVDGQLEMVATLDYIMSNIDRYKP